MSIDGCIKCGAPFVPAELLARLKGYDRGTDSGVSSCHACGETLELRVRAGKLELGYTYWAGSMHFEGMVEVPARGLRRLRAGDAETCALDGRSYTLFQAGPSGPA